MTNHNQQTSLPRRNFLSNLSSGLAGISLASLLQDEARAAGVHQTPNGQPHFTPKAKSVIWLFMRGGVSHMESFDPKPMLNKYAGKSISETPWKSVQQSEKLKRVRVVVVNDANGQQRNKVYPLQVGYKKYGESGIEVSDWFPHLGGCVDDLSIVRSMWTTDDNHGAQVQFHSGRHMLDGRVPTIGAWVNYGLGSLNQNLPQFINMGPRFFDVRDGHYLGPAYDSVPLKVDPKNPLPYAKPELDLSSAEQKIEFSLINQLNQQSAEKFPNDSTLQARIKSYELAFRMQTAVPEVIRFDQERDSGTVWAEPAGNQGVWHAVACGSAFCGEGRSLHPDHAWRWCRGCLGFPFESEVRSLQTGQTGRPASRRTAERFETSRVAERYDRCVRNGVRADTRFAGE